MKKPVISLIIITLLSFNSFSQGDLSIHGGLSLSTFANSSDNQTFKVLGVTTSLRPRYSLGFEYVPYDFIKEKLSLVFDLNINSRWVFLKGSDTYEANRFTFTSVDLSLFNLKYQISKKISVSGGGMMSVIVTGKRDGQKADELGSSTNYFDFLSLGANLGLRYSINDKLGIYNKTSFINSVFNLDNLNYKKGIITSEFGVSYFLVKN